MYYIDLISTISCCASGCSADGSVVLYHQSSDLPPSAIISVSLLTVDFKDAYTSRRRIHSGVSWLPGAIKAVPREMALVKLGPLYKDGEHKLDFMARSVELGNAVSDSLRWILHMRYLHES